MNKGNILIESLISFMIVGFLILWAIESMQSVYQESEPPQSVFDELNKDCDTQCVLEMDIP